MSEIYGPERIDPDRLITDTPRGRLMLEKRLPDGRTLTVQPQIYNWRLVLSADPTTQFIDDEW